MSFKSILSTVLVLTGISLGTVLFNFADDSSVKNNDNVKVVADCDSSQWIYKQVLIDGVWWIIVYNCDGAIINEYPAT